MMAKMERRYEWWNEEKNEEMKDGLKKWMYEEMNDGMKKWMMEWRNKW